MVRFIVLVICLVGQIFSAHGMLGETDPIAESRVYTKSLDFECPASQTECLANLWAKRHAPRVQLLGDWLGQNTASPTNVALAQVTFAGKSGSRDCPVNDFITSKANLTFRTTKAPITPAHFQELLAEQGVSGYEDYGLCLVGNYYTSIQRGLFKAWLQRSFEEETRLASSRVAERLEEIAADRLDFFYHSEQALLLAILKDSQVFWTKTFGERAPQEPIEVVSLSILSYFDPCRRCGDFLLRASESFLKKSLVAFFETKRWNPDFLQETFFFIRVAGINSYRDPLLRGDKAPALRPENPDILGALFNGPLAPMTAIVPRVCCTVERWLT